ncbi:double-strand break repair helicase AddA [Sphingomonas sp. AP4-R1]|uniref:double-strand break repair helicase AddA n=1 Tax=Sphingomonas sp. AP4-R1 TaxID=2735134 RepID=UPI001493B6C5|nr:double-strand break repair helicase AddA [Sphingomonas sp. AP4-R1]QJU58692.1 double-strand break repair helicase AddA [Sphingomonas sp. AP4-R1]
MSARIEPLRRLAGAQADASDPKRQVWLSASAGTGKTHVLTARVLRLLLSGARPSSILCLTFTKAGAAEMAERIQSRLASWVRLDEKKLEKELFALGEPNDAEAIRKARRLFARVLDAPGGGLRIQTIHAFSQTLLASFPTEAGLAPGFKPLDGRAEAALARETLARLLADAESGGDLGLVRDVQVLSRRLGEQAAERYLRLCARSPRAMAELGSREGLEPRIRTGLGIWLGDIEARIVGYLDDDTFDSSLLRAIGDAYAAWGTKTGLERAAVAGAFLEADAGARAGMLGDLLRIAVTAAGAPYAHSQKLLDCDPAHGDNCESLAEAIGMLLEQRRGAELAALLAAGLRAGQSYAAAYERAKRAAGAVDFDDLIRLVLDLLEEPGVGDWIRFKLDRRVDHLLIDEGQDTNVAQWRIVRALADDFFTVDPDEAERERLHRTIFSVGDFKQAIFGFQGTDPQAFAAARAFFGRRIEEGDRQLDRLSLDRSFRSTPPILALVDRLNADLGKDALGLADELEPHQSAKDGKLGTVTLLAPMSVAGGDAGEDEGDESWLDDATRGFAQRLAQQVSEWLAQPLWLPGKGRALRPEDILILVRRRGELASLIVARLHAESVPVAGVDRLRLDAPLAVRDLMAAIRFVLQPGDDLSLASLLVSPLFGLSQDDLYAVGFRREGSLWAALQRHPDQAAATEHLRELLRLTDFTTPYAFLETILTGALDGRRKLLSRLGDEARDPIEELLNAAMLFESEATPTLQRFLDWFDRGEVEVTRDPSAPLDAVRVMTVHGAKGLQAPLVILADATGDPARQPARDVNWAIEEESAPVPIVRPRKAERIGPLEDRIAEIERREREEHWRLLYVAVTRAEEHLVIGGALGPAARGVPPAESWYAAIERAMEGLGAEPVDDPLWAHARHYRGDRPAVAPVRAERVARPERAPSPLPHWAKRPAPLEALPPRPLAPSSLGDDLAASPPPSPAMRAAAERGRLLHALFERLPALAPDQRLAAAERWLTGAGGVTDAEAARTLATDACRILADPALAEIFSPEALAEAPIAAVLESGHVVAGTVDRLLVTDDRVLLLDYKTGRAIPPSAEEAPVMHLRQMSAYVDALARIFPGRTIEAALLYTAGPRLFPLAPDLLARHKPDYAGAQQKLGAKS